MRRIWGVVRRYCAPVVVALTLVAGTTLPTSSAPQLVTVRMILDPTIYSHLPVLHALDAGYFRDEGIDLQITPAQGSSTLFLPMLARGDYDLGTVNPSPAFFNQFTAGFDVVILAAQAGNHAGWHAANYLVVRQDLWDTKAIMRPSDLKGRSIDGSNNGSPVDFLVKETLRAGGLSADDVHLTEHLRDAPAWVEALRNHAEDVVGTIEPSASELEGAGLGHRWLSLADIAPWYQLEYIGASAKFANAHPELIRRILRAYLRANDDILKTNGKWTPALLAEAQKWTHLPVDELERLSGPNYPTEHGEVSLDALVRMQQFWIGEKLVTTPVDVNRIVNVSMLHEEQHSLHF